ncbi:hypothetical protein NADE_006201 [Nannochloris sp. 'desiccata']|nr:hypothetical protein NADE_006201 [Chlorella desiccata (nom. nud.)]
MKGATGVEAVVSRQLFLNLRQGLTGQQIRVEGKIHEVEVQIKNVEIQVKALAVNLKDELHDQLGQIRGELSNKLLAVDNKLVAMDFTLVAMRASMERSEDKLSAQIEKSSVLSNAAMEMLMLELITADHHRITADTHVSIEAIAEAAEAAAAEAIASIDTCVSAVMR